jgi:MerR family mercuric resistance operon transcriptional regulator
MKRLRIGQVAELAGVGIPTLRFYEKEGLIPAPERRSSGYREYKPEVVRRVRFIRRAKELGFTLKEIQELLSIRTSSPQTCEEIRSQVKAKTRDIEERIASLERMKVALHSLAEGCDGKDSIESCPIIAALDDCEHHTRALID